MIKKKDFIWIDKIIDKGENQGYIQIMKDRYNIYNLKPAFQYIMNSLKFKVIVLKVSGSLFSTYIKAFDNYKNKLTTISLTIIFTRSV